MAEAIPDELSEREAVKWEKGRWIDSPNNREYRVPIRTLWLRANNLSVGVCARSSSTDGYKSTRLQASIFGNGRLDGQSAGLSVIGNRKLRTRHFSLSLRKFDRHKPSANLAERRLSKEEPIDDAGTYKAHLNRIVGDKTITACLGFLREDWETENRDDWFVEIYVACESFERLIDGIRQQKISEILLGVDFLNLYVTDYHAPPSVEVEWFLPQSEFGECDSGIGFLTHISWREISPGLADAEKNRNFSIAKVIGRGRSADELAGYLRTIRDWVKERIDDPGRFSYSQFNTLLNELGDRVLAYSRARDESAEALRARLGDAHDVLSRIKFALTPQLDEQDRNRRYAEMSDEQWEREIQVRKHQIWRRRDPEQVMRMGFESTDHVEINREELSHGIAQYLERPWLQNTQIEWLLIDALIFSEIVAFGEKIKEGLTEKRDFLGINEHYFATQGNLHKMGNRLLKEQLTTLATKVGAFIIMPVIVLGVVAKSDRFDLALTGVVIYPSSSHSGFSRELQKPWFDISILHLTLKGDFWHFGARWLRYTVFLEGQLSVYATLCVDDRTRAWRCVGCVDPCHDRPYCGSRSSSMDRFGGIRIPFLSVMRRI